MLRKFVNTLHGLMLRASLALLALAVMPIATSRADVITVPHVTLLANTPGQTVLITISGATAVAGEDFFAQIGDGGTFNKGTNTKPIFTNVDILTGTIFAASNTGATRDPNNPESAHPLIWVDGTTTNTSISPTVTDSGLLATLTIDTTGVTSGTFPLILSGVGSGLTTGGFTTDLIGANNAPISLTINNGSITIAAPEPVGLALFGIVLIVTRRRRRKLT
ncbi:MAG: hypothetical protein JWN40_2640 [Phycisphaerales bacterium]|nr:hypothetical protein [Phycisphaerales bacterium]